jgi:hypothetical protein
MIIFGIQNAEDGTSKRTFVSILHFDRCDVHLLRRQYGKGKI